MSDWCSEPWKERREAEDAARRGYMNYEQRERHREGRYAGFGSCDREFYDAYERERGRIDDERRAEEDAVERRLSISARWMQPTNERCTSANTSSNRQRNSRRKSSPASTRGAEGRSEEHHTGVARA